ncbi:acyltransferase [Psychroserpens luteus]|uniref:Acyltransferase n=1 Tax=Psychroserpens luteus TaxID=1434066 RepID=A0ABW5ZZX6_9FLAO|nr:acyltransferase [Psychroserpens luteus]
MKAIILLIKFIIKKWVRKAYWLFRLTKVSFGKSPDVSFPFSIEGKGKIAASDFFKSATNISLGAGVNASLKFGNKNTLEKDVKILVGENCNLEIGNDFLIGQGTRLFVQNDWKFHNNTSINSYCSVFSRESNFKGKLEMLNNSHIADYCIIDVSDDILIGENVAIGPNCTFYTHDHEYHQMDKAAWNGDIITGKIVIGSDSWLGSNVTVLPGVTIGKHVVVAAGSVVTKDLNDNCVYAGVPAKKIKTIE